MADSLKIGIFGAGSIGCYVGGCLSAAGYDVTFIGRQRIAQDIKNKAGLVLSDYRGKEIAVPEKSFTFSLSPEPMGQSDVIIVTVKSGDTQSAIDEIAKHAKPEAIITSFQNGVSNGKILKEKLPKMSVLTGMVPFNVINNSPAHFHCGTEGKLALESNNGIETPLVKALANANLGVHTYTNMEPVLWGKLVMNLNNSINALSGVPLLEQLHNITYRKVLAASIKEALHLLKAAGIKPARTGKVVPALLPGILALPNWLFTKVANAMLKIDPEAKSSMAQDLELGRKTEIDFLNGEIVALSNQYGVPSPVNGKIAALIKKAEAAKSGSPCISAEALSQAVFEG